MSNADSHQASADARLFLRHTIATLAYRGGKVVANAPAGFADFRVNDKTRSPGEVLAHIGDLLDWALHVAKGEQVYNESPPLSWPDGVARFFNSLRELDTYLASDAALGSSVELIFQGPIADALTHVGQLAMLRRMAGAPVRGENYFRAEIIAGRVGPAQSAPRGEFD